MKSKTISALGILISVVLIVSAFNVVFVNVGAASVSLPDYAPIDIVDAPRYSVKVEESIQLPTHHSYFSIGDIAYWLVLDDYYGVYRLRTFQYVANSSKTEIWVQTNLGWPAGDPRTYPTILNTEIQYLLNEFDTKIYSTDTQYFGVPKYRNGSDAAFPAMLGLPPDYYYDNGTTMGRNVILVSNIRDENYYNASYPYYVAGFFSSAFDDFYFDRNIINIDSYAWERRIGPNGTEWISGIKVNRPYVYESTIAHEYQHLIHHDYNPSDDAFMNEGASMYAELLNGYGIDPSYLNSYFATPDNSLTVWSDQGDINILADYGAAALWATYLSDHYGGANLISYFVQAGVPGIDGINAALAHFGYKQTFDDVYHDWRLANLIRSDFPGNGKYNYQSLNLNDPSNIPVRKYNVNGIPVPWTKSKDFGNTTTILGYDTGVSMVGPYGSDYVTFGNWTKPGIMYFDGDDTASYGWTMTNGVWWSGFGNMLNVQLIGQAQVNPSNPTLTLVTKYGIESNWDFGFVQVSTDNGQTWASLANSYTNSSYLTDVKAIINNLPGLTDYNPEWPGWTTMTFDLSAYKGQNVMIDFRYMTDEFTNYEGWFIQNASVSGTTLTLTPIYPKATFQITVVNAFVIDGKTYYVPLDMFSSSPANTGISAAFAKNPNFVVLVVSPTMHNGFADYRFKVSKFPF